MKITKRLSALILSVVLLLTLVTLPVSAEEAVQQDIKGDVNGDGNVNSSDALLVLKHAVKKSELTGKPLQQADVNKDGVINSSDALVILKIAVGMEDEDPKPSDKEDVVALYNTSLINSAEQSKLVLDISTDVSVKVNKFLLDGEENEELTKIFEDSLNETEYEDLKLTFVNGETEDGIIAADLFSTLAISADDVETATAVPHGDGYKVTLKLYPVSETYSEDDLAGSGYESYKENVNIEILAVTDGQGRLMLLDYYTYGNVKATATEEGVKVTMDFDMEEREVMSFAY